MLVPADPGRIAVGEASELVEDGLGEAIIDSAGGVALAEVAVVVSVHGETLPTACTH